jgi:hypothetical protein
MKLKKDKIFKIVYWISTGLLTVMMLMSASMYIMNNAEMQEAFTFLGFPAYIVYPLAIAKILGLTAIWIGKFKSLKEWAYAGFFFNFVLAFFAHYMTTGTDFESPLMALLLLFTSYITWKKIKL